MTARERLVDALMKHARRCDPNHPGYGNCRCGVHVEAPGEHHEHLADVLLALDGIVVVELPQANDHGDWHNGYVWTRAGRVRYHSDQLTPERARTLAAALLAAADAAEQSVHT